MTWIKTVAPAEDARVGEALQAQAAVYPDEYGPHRQAERRVPAAVMNDSIVLSHSLIPEALRHAFGTFGALMNPELPLARRQHEMIALTVSTLNRCFY
jgi:hypothetical protein